MIDFDSAEEAAECAKYLEKFRAQRGAALYKGLLLARLDRAGAISVEEVQ